MCGRATMEGEDMKVKMLNWTLHISEGNGKIGKTMNWSLMPGRTCSAEACRTCLRGGCYAASIARRRPNVAKAWAENTEAMEGLQKSGLWVHWISQMVDIIQTRKPRYFRVHVGGDFFSREYFKAWVLIAKQCPDTSFFAFTKQWDNVKGVALLDNFRLIASHWTGCEIPKWAAKRLPVAWLVEKNAPVPVRGNGQTYVCQGDCTKCHWCNNLTRERGDVAFLKHR